MSVEVSDTQESQSGAGSGQKGPVGGSMDAPSHAELGKAEAEGSHSLGMGFMKCGRVFFWEKKIKTWILPSTRPHREVPKYRHVLMDLSGPD